MGVTNMLYQALATHLSQGTTPAAADTPAWIGLETNSTMGGGTSAYTVSTNAFVSECAVSGLTRAGVTLSLITTSVAADTCRSNVVFTAGGSTTIYGHACMSASTAGNMMSWYAYAAGQALASSDTLTCRIDHQMVVGS